MRFFEYLFGESEHRKMFKGLQALVLTLSKEISDLKEVVKQLTDTSLVEKICPKCNMVMDLIKEPGFTVWSCECGEEIKHDAFVLEDEE